MKPLHPLSRSIAFAVASLISSAFLLARQETGAKTTQSSTAESYPDTTDGLRSLLTDLLFTAKSDDPSKLWSKIADMEIPNYEHWFTATFGQDKGESWAEPYGKSLRANEKQFHDLLMQLAPQDGEISVQTVDTTKKYDTLTGPLDEYLADWKKSGAPEGQSVEHIGFFYFIEGKFRWDSTVRFVRIQKANSGSLFPARLTKRVPPEYPEEARQKRIQGTVVLNATIRKDGSVTVQSVASGDPVLSPAAIKAVRHWHYEPTLLNGQPVEVKTQIQVVFMLATP
jgi:TonB family protein